MAKFKRILLKLSGESLMGEQGYGIDVKRLNEYAAQIKEVAEMGVQIGIVIGGVFGLAIAVFALYWFFFTKRTFAELFAVIAYGFKKIATFFSSLFGKKSK